jgi:hypothetical protein
MYVIQADCAHGLRVHFVIPPSKHYEVVVEDSSCMLESSYGAFTMANHFIRSHFTCSHGSSFEITISDE